MCSGELAIRLADANDAVVLRDLYVQAFTSNPAYASIFQFGSSSKYNAALEWLFQRRALSLIMTNGCCLYCGLLPCCNSTSSSELPSSSATGNSSTCNHHTDTVEPAGSRPAAVASSESIVQPLASVSTNLVAAVAVVPFDSKPSWWCLIKLGLWQWRYLWGFASLFRALQLDRACAAAAAAHKELNIVGEIVMMAVSPEQQGKGLGSALLKHCLQEWDRSSYAAAGGSLILATQKQENVVFYGRHGFKLLSSHDAGGYTTWHMHRPAAAETAAVQEQT